MRFCILLFCALGWLIPCHATQAAPFTAVIDGMSVTVSEPWALYTRSFPEFPESFTLIYGKVDERGGGDIVGEGYAYLYPLRQEERPPTHEALKSMTAAELQSLVRALGKGHLHFPEPRGSVELVRRKGHSVIFCKEFQAGSERVPEPCYSFISYHLLGDRLAVFFAYVYGSEAEVRLLETICGSFDYTSSGIEELLSRNSVAQDGISFNIPRNWHIRVSPETDSGPVWSELSIQDMDDRNLATVLLLRPEETKALPAPEDVLRRLRYEAWGKEWTTHIVGIPLTPENCRPAGSGQSEINWPAATLDRYDCTDGHKQLSLKIDSLSLGGKNLSIVTGYRKPLPDALREELASIYASVTCDEQESGRTDR